MPGYRYIALTPTGERTSGVLAVASESAAIAELERQRLAPVQVIAQDEAGGAARFMARRKSGGVPLSQLATAYQQIADLLRAGVPLLRAIKLIAGRKDNPRLAEVFGGIAQAVEDGRDLAAAMSDRPEVFRPIHVAMVRAGEKGGFLEPALARLSKLVTGQVELRQKIVGSLVYPCTIAALGLLMVLAVFLVYVPQFKSVFEDVQLPTLTKIVFAMSDALNANWVITLVALIVLIVALVVGLRSDAGREWGRRAVLRVPLVGPIIRLLAVARVSRVLGALLTSGVPVLAALGIAKDAAGTPAMTKAVEDATEAVRAGKSLVEPMRASGAVPDDVLEMIGVGESANNLGEVLSTVADTLETRLDRRLSTAVRFIEPITLLGLGVGIAIIALALIMPMLRLTSGMGVE